MERDFAAFFSKESLLGDTLQPLNGSSNPCRMRLDGKGITTALGTKFCLRPKKSRQMAGRHHPPPMPGMQHSPASQQQYVSEHRHDFFNVMSYQNQGRRVFSPPHTLQKLQKVFSRSGIQPRARLVQNQECRPRHQRPANQDSLPFPLR